MEKVLTGRTKPEWDNIESIRSQAFDFLKQNSIRPEDTDAVLMVIGELLENAIKYGIFPDNDQIDYSISISKREIITEVKNRISSDEDENLKMLDKTIQWIRGYQNPFQAYIEKLKEVSVRPMDDGASGIGLTRIAYEGQSIVDFYVGEGDIISVSAVRKLN